MRDQLQQRIQTLKTEFEAGQAMLAELEAKEANLRQTLLRIGGAIQVLEEILTETSEADIGLSESPNSGAGTISSPQPAENLTL